MEVAGKNEFESVISASTYDRKTEIKAFDESKAGVKGLLDCGVTKIPHMFHHTGKMDLIDEDNYREKNDSKLAVPVIDLKDWNSNSDLHAEIIDQIRNACEKGGCFYVINHGIPTEILDEMIKGIQRFHEQDTEVKKQFYTRDLTKKVRYVSNFSLYQDQAATWKDTFVCEVAPDPLQPEELPSVCREIVIEYSKQVRDLGFKILELMSKALALDPSYLEELGCAEELLLLGHYYPACPQPKLTMASSKHTDRGFITILLKDQLGGLQVLHQNQWLDIPPIHGALLVNIVDLLQLMTNDKLKSVYHRV